MMKKGTFSEEYAQRMSVAHAAKVKRGFQVTILGESDAGKTSLLNRMVHDEFHVVDATVGFNYLTKQMVVSNRPIELHLWDTAGSERYHSVSPFIYKNAAVIILVFDLTDEMSFDKLSFWVEKLEGLIREPVVILVGNKKDLEDKREVSKEKISTFAKDHNYLYLEASAKTGENITEILRVVGRGIFEKYQHEIDD